MNDVEVLKYNGKVTNTYNQSSSIPTSGLSGVGVSAYNLDTSNELTIRLILDNSETLDIEIPIATAWDDVVPNYKGLQVIGLSAEYKILVRERI
jgi:hypothetical protein